MLSTWITPFQNCGFNVCSKFWYHSLFSRMSFLTSWAERIYSVRRTLFGGEESNFGGTSRLRFFSPSHPQKFSISPRLTSTSLTCPSIPSYHSKLATGNWNKVQWSSGFVSFTSSSWYGSTYLWRIACGLNIRWIDLDWHGMTPRLDVSSSLATRFNKFKVLLGLFLLQRRNNTVVVWLFVWIEEKEFFKRRFAARSQKWRSIIRRRLFGETITQDHFVQSELEYCSNLVEVIILYSFQTSWLVGFSAVIRSKAGGVVWRTERDCRWELQALWCDSGVGTCSIRRKFENCVELFRDVWCLRQVQAGVRMTIREYCVSHD